MAETESFIALVCGFCEQPIKSPAASEGRVGRCPICRQSVVAPRMGMASDSVSFDQPLLPRVRSAPRLRELIHGAVVSLVFHAVLMSLLAVIIIKSPELGRSLLVTLFCDAEGSDIKLDEMPLEAPTVDLAMIEGDASEGGNGIGVGDVEEVAVPDGPKGYGAGGIDQLIRGTRSVDPLARFSSIAMERLSRQPAARRGDYEIALFWDGPSDLDVHVNVETTNGRTIRIINYQIRGTPETGFLDVDQNAGPPEVDDPIEHIRWNTKSPPDGLYRIRVHGYALRSATGPDPRAVPFTVEIKTPAGIRSFSSAVAEKRFVHIETLAIGDVFDKTADETASRLLAHAKVLLNTNDRLVRKRVKRILANIRRDYPESKAADEVEMLLKSMD